MPKTPSGAPVSLGASHLDPYTIENLAQDAGLAITNQSPDMVFLDSTTGTKTLTIGTGADEPVVGQRLTFYMSIRSGGDYRMPIILNAIGDFLFMNGVGEGGSMVYNGTGWVLTELRAATISS